MGQVKASSDFINYSPDDVALKLDLSIQGHDFYEVNVTITQVNQSMTLISQISSGKIWGVYLEPRYNYYYEKERVPDPSVFCGAHALIGDQLLVGADYYSTAHVSRLLGDYTLAIYNLDAADVQLDLELILVKGNIGKEVNIPPSDLFASLDLSLFKFPIIITIFLVGTFLLFKLFNKIDKFIFNN